MPNKKRAAENRSEVILFRTRPAKKRGLERLAEEYDISEAEVIRRLLEPAIDEELEYLRQRTTMKTAGLRERTRQTKERLKSPTRTDSKLSKLGTG
jgi:hypothetical protein